MAKEPTVETYLRIPWSIKQKLKKQSAEMDISMTQIIVDLLEEHFQENNKKQEK